MSKSESWLTSNRLLLLGLILSVAMLLFGLWLIGSAGQEPLPPAATVDDEIPLPPLPAISQDAPPDLDRLQEALASMAAGIIPSNLNFTAEEIAAALAQAEPGSEAWCDLLLLKNDADWTESEAEGFAEACI